MRPVAEESVALVLIALPLKGKKPIRDESRSRSIEIESGQVGAFRNCLLDLLSEARQPSGALDVRQFER